jgi:hypothetical protein
MSPAIGGNIVGLSALRAPPMLVPACGGSVAAAFAVVDAPAASVVIARCTRCCWAIVQVLLVSQ